MGKKWGVRVMVNASFDHLLLVSVNPEVFPFWGERPDFLPIILYTHAGVALRAGVDIIRSHGFSSVFYNLGLVMPYADEAQGAQLQEISPYFSRLQLFG
jgi:hypothetical protein